MEKDVLVIGHFTSDFDGAGNNRFNYLVDLLSKYPFDVELVTSDFSHSKKIKRERIQDFDFKLTYLREPLYKKNISLKRIYSHYILGENLKRYLNYRKKPDIIYCAVPSLNVAKVAADYAKKNRIKFVIDVQDLWPEAFKMLIKIPLLSDVIFYPMKRKADHIFKLADEIIAVSDTYAHRAKKVNFKCDTAHTIFLGTELSFFDRVAQENKIQNKPDNEIWLAYVGTLGHSYDLTSVMEALYILKGRGIDNIKFIVMGDGPLKKKFEENANKLGIYTKFTGRLDYSKMAGLLYSCDIAVNPISKGAAQSIINKHGDYAAAELPVLNTQECSEYRWLVDEYKMGLNCKNNDPKDLSTKLLKLYEDKPLRKALGKNSRKLAEDKFDRSHTYRKIVEIINGV
ncbi:glycosyltransferase family 4 protein [Cytobacillus horneckiae]|uniref:glycosyltransferase family 4 protein n=1 Tax=Cytobacillus horneckiae TaxID=549687 RepID=UPI003D9A625D